jgi:hypothetical protein
MAAIGLFVASSLFGGLGGLVLESRCRTERERREGGGGGGRERGSQTEE